MAYTKRWARARSPSSRRSATKSCWDCSSCAGNMKRSERVTSEPLARPKYSESRIAVKEKASMTDILQDIRQPGAGATRLRVSDSAKTPSPPEVGRKRIVIVGAGFAGIAAARALKRCDADVILVDRRNHHIFQPLLYQVA